MGKIALNDVTKHFGDITALDSVSLSVEPGEIFGFLGPNGAGKSTAIRCILGSIFPDSGTINVDGEIVTRKSFKYKSKIGYVPSDDNLEKNWDSAQHIRFVLKARSLDTDPGPLIKRLGLNTSKKVKELSTGNKQKLSIVLALIVKPEILIMDEPTRGLDPLLQEEIYDILHEFKDDGGSVFFSSHILSEVERLCDRVAIIRNGSIVANETMDILQKIQVHRAEVGFQEDLPIQELSSIGEVETISTQKAAISIKGDINPLIKLLSNYEISDLNIKHASLEDTFLHFYEGEK